MGDITVSVLIGIVIMLGLVAGIFIFFFLSQKKKIEYQSKFQTLREQQQNQLIEAAVLSEESERHRIAEQLHDEVGAILSSTRLHFSNINSAQLDDKGRTLHEKSKELLDESIQKVRSISHNLHSTLLKEFGLNEAIRHFLGKTAQSSIVATETELDANYLIQHPQIDLGVYRIVQEVVNNTLKHAGATKIKVVSKHENNFLRVEISHNGEGITQHQFESLRYKPDGLGLKNIQNRIILLKGTIHFERSGGENKITITIPTTEES